jgi:hypothetical protein
VEIPDNLMERLQYWKAEFISQYFISTAGRGLLWANLDGVFSTKAFTFMSAALSGIYRLGWSVTLERISLFGGTLIICL